MNFWRNFFTTTPLLTNTVVVRNEYSYTVRYTDSTPRTLATQIFADVNEYLT